MDPEGNRSYSRQTYEDTEKEIGDIARSVDANTPIEEIREKFAEQDTLTDKKEAFHSEARDQAKVENTIRDESIKVQKVAEQNEATSLLKKMHENAGIKQETATVTSKIEKKQQGKIEEAERLYKSLTLSRAFKESKYQGASDSSLSGKIEMGLGDEEVNDRVKRNKFFIGTEVMAMATLLTSIGGLVASSTEATIFGYSGATLATAGFSLGAIGIAAAATGALGWAGMRAYHALKEHRHKKAFDELGYGV